ncbi:MAG: MAPEG family protein [Nannocystaceae bacterium]|nr:MAPEG family protein [Nannocystaceae bacterium]
MNPILAPVVALVAWTFVMWLWMYATRLPAMRRARVKSDPMRPRGEQAASLPARVRWKADNYNHLMEMPTLFYAIALVLALAGPADSLNTSLAWGYVGLRVVHSLWQALINNIEVRFLIFFASSCVLFVLVVRAALVVF